MPPPAAPPEQTEVPGGIELKSERSRVRIRACAWHASEMKRERNKECKDSGFLGGALSRQMADSSVIAFTFVQAWNYKVKFS